MRAAIFLLTALISMQDFASAQTAPEQVTAGQIANYQLGMERGCKNRGRERGDPVERVNAFCDCMMSRLKANMTQAEWQKAFYFALTHRQDEEMQVVAPYFAKLQACKD